LSNGSVEHTGFFFASSRHTMDVTLNSSNNNPATIDGESITYSTNSLGKTVGSVSIPEDGNSSMDFELYDGNGDGTFDSAAELDANDNVVANYNVLWDNSNPSAITVDFITTWSSYADDYLWGEFLDNNKMSLSTEPMFDWDAITDAVSGVIGDNDEILVGDSGDSAIMIVGYGGDDTITGTDGGDWIYGDAGDDVMTGNDGADLFVFNTDDSQVDFDVITDFSASDGDLILIDGSALFDDTDGSYDFAFESGTYDSSTDTFAAVTNGFDTAITFGSTAQTQMIVLEGVNASSLVFADIEDSVAIWLNV
jgi:Ca2+-binding RTX toxin-like protein